MKITQHLALKLTHLFNAKNRRGFGIHSPFLFGLVQQVLRNKHPYYCFAKIEAIRNSLRHSNQKIFVQDYGTGKSEQRSIAKIAKTSLATPKDAQTLFRIARYIQAKSILELGTSLGITTTYLASTSSKVKCVTMEGSDQLIKIAKQTAHKANLNNITFIQGDITANLKNTLTQYEPFDMVYFDANHTLQHTLLYFNECVKRITPSSVFVFDDINTSFQMNQAWKQIVQHNKVTAALQLSRFGLVFFDEKLQKKTYYI